eukprot:SAG11_NODE_1395_length_5038_cov_1.168050_7_plen_266_part_00
MFTWLLPTARPRTRLACTVRRVAANLDLRCLSQMHAVFRICGGLHGLQLPMAYVTFTEMAADDFLLTPADRLSSQLDRDYVRAASTASTAWSAASPAVLRHYISGVVQTGSLSACLQSDVVREHKRALLNENSLKELHKRSQAEHNAKRLGNKVAAKEQLFGEIKAALAESSGTVTVRPHSIKCIVCQKSLHAAGTSDTYFRSEPGKKEQGTIAFLFRRSDTLCCCFRQAELCSVPQTGTRRLNVRRGCVAHSRALGCRTWPFRA